MALLVTACARNVSPDTYSVGAVGQVNRAVQGTIISARPVKISGTTALGGTAGAVSGGVAGSAIGGSTRGHILGAVGGAVVGGLVGAAIEEGVTRQDGMEYVVKAENGALLTITQGAEPAFSVGEKVIVLYGSRSRVVRDASQDSQKSNAADVKKDEPSTEQEGDTPTE